MGLTDRQTDRPTDVGGVGWEVRGDGQGTEGVDGPAADGDTSTSRFCPRPRPLRSYSRALGALRAHDEAELVDAALGEAVGLRIRAEGAELVGGGGVGTLGQVFPGP